MRRHIALPIMFVGITTFVAVGCTGESSAPNAGNTAATATATASATRATGSAPVDRVRSTATDTPGQLVALTIIDTAGFHAMDEGLNESGGTIDPQWLGKVRHGQIAVAAVSWPDSLKAPAQAFIEAAQKLATAIEADDAAAAAPAAKEAHETQHELSTKGWALLAEHAGVELASHEEATPTASPSPQGR